jgi:hypothetical protein
MPAAIDPTNTFRLWVNYNDGKYDHSIQFRYDGSVTSEAEVMTVADDYFTAIAGAAYLIGIGVVEFAGEGTNVRNPVAWTGAATYGTGAMPDVNAPRYIQFTGKDQTGHRWHLEQFGLDFATPATYALGTLDDADIGAAFGVLQAAFTAGTIQSINKHKVLLNPAMPVGFNDHFIVQNRG